MRTEKSGGHTWIELRIFLKLVLVSFSLAGVAKKGK